MFEICRADVPTLARLKLSVPAFELTTCTTAGATLERINSISVCVVRECVQSPTASGAAAAGIALSPLPLSSATPAATTTPPPAKDASVLNNGSTSRAGSEFSSKAIVVIGGASFAVGLVVAALALVLYRKRASDAARRRHDKARHYHAFGRDEPRSGTAYDDDDSVEMSVVDDVSKSGDSSWVFEHPRGFPSAVALLEEDDDRTRSKKPGLLDDLLVFEIPPEEIKLRGPALSPSPSTTETSSSSASGQVPIVRLVAEYQGYHVLLHALVRQKKTKRRDERRFIEQIRLASALDHPSLVQFIGLTFGTTASRQQLDATTPRWAFAVVFEYMHRGSLAAMCERERSRRDGKAYNAPGTHAVPSDANNLFSWFPTRPSASATPDADWRCKLSIALDIAMALVYLHANQLVHGRLSARHVLVNDHGEAKLSALDLSRPRDVVDSDASLRTSARMKMKHMISFKQSSFSQSALGSSLLHGGAVATPTLAPETPLFRETKNDIYAFGLLLWELDTMLSLDALQDATTAATGADHARLTFTSECPREIERLARRCWSKDASERPDALDLQEELVQLLEGRITTSSHAVSSWLRTTNQSLLSSFSSSNLSASSSLSSASVYALSEVEASI